MFSETGIIYGTLYDGNFVVNAGQLEISLLKTFWGTVKGGKIELLEPSELVEGTQVLVTLIPDIAPI